MLTPYSKKILAALMVLSGGHLINGCATSTEVPPELAEKITEHRQVKNLTFKTSPNSPIPDDLKGHFNGLNYFQVDLRYRFKSELHKYDAPRTVSMVTSTGAQKVALRYGYFKFDMHGQTCILQVYKLVDVQREYPDYLFVPFADATTGKESYPGGRYLDFTEKPDGVYDIDFNLAYNPFCAYGKEGYNCPLPPQENRLDVPIRAGEKTFDQSSH